MKSREPTHNQQTRSVCNALGYYARDCMAFSRKAQALPRGVSAPPFSLAEPWLSVQGWSLILRSLDLGP